MVLVDTSVWWLALRRRGRLAMSEAVLVAAWSDLVRWGHVAMIGPIRQELLSGVRSEEQFSRLESGLKAFPDEILTEEDYVEAARCFNRCRAVGAAATHIDMLICAVAFRRDWSVFTADNDFKRYQRVLKIELYQPRAS